MLFDPSWKAKPVKTTPRLKGWQQSMLEAAQWLRTHKWGRGSYHHLGYDTYCMIGAVKEVVASHRQEKKIRDMLHEYLQYDPEAWNDTRAPSKRTVIQVLEYVATDYVSEE